MDPLTAIGLVSNILSFIDFSARLLEGAKEVHDSQNGVLEENRNRETVVREMQRMSTRMLVSGSSEKAIDDSTLGILAAECRGLSTQLISLLEKIKPEDSASKAQSFLSAMRNKVYNSERESLEARLNDCRAQLNLELSHLTRTEMLEKLESLVHASKLDEAKLDRIESHIAQLRENISSVPSTSEAKPMLMTLLAEEEKVFTTIALDRILNCLSFEGMNRRSNMVVETHSNTYEWIMEDDPMAEESSPEHDKNSGVESQPQRIEDIEKVRAKEKLRAWLESRNSRDVFHLSGKLGSGKSTLMKHVRASPRTEEKLKTWADGRKLTIAHFYFWNIGSEYEKSLQGLYRSLLSQIFSQCPDFISNVWPKQWAQANSAPWIVPKIIKVSQRDVTQAFTRVIESHDMLKNHCFAFFIDGLDEFQSTVQDDHRDLVKLLCRWAASPSGNIKICVSSREYPVFMDGFSPTLRIRLHDLTRRDMDTYIRDKLAHASAEGSFENLVSLIMNKANGVFLWVALVVKSLREGLENGLSCSDLTQEVDILPEQLESLYKHILMSLGKSARRKAYQTFAMVAELKKYANYRMSLLAYSFFEEYEAGGKFFMKEGNVFPMASLIGNCGKERAQSSSRKLAGWCKGLVELYKTPPPKPREKDGLDNPRVAEWGDWSMELDFAHRSVSDFLESDEVQRDMQLNLKAFDPVDAVLNLIVSDILYDSSKSFHNTPRSGVASTVSMRIMDDYNLIREPFPFINRFRELLAAMEPVDPTILDNTLIMYHFFSRGEIVSVAQAEFVGAVTGTSEIFQKAHSNRQEAPKVRRHYLSDPFLKLAVIGLEDYPLWHIANRSGLSEQPATISALACFCLDEGTGWDSDDYLRPLNLLEALFKQRWISPDTVTNCRHTRYRGLWSESLGQSSNLTLWHRFVIKMLSGRYYNVSKDAMMTERDHRIFQRRTQYEGKLFQLFLQFKPDMEFSYEICVNEETPASRRDFLLSLGRQGVMLKFTFVRVFQDEEDESLQPWMESEIGLPLQYGTPARRHFSMIEFIELSVFDNKAELLEMVDGQSEPSGEVQHNKSTEAASITGKEGGGSDEAQSLDEGQRIAGGQSNFGLIKILNLHHHLGKPSQWVRYILRNEYVRLAVAALTGAILTTLFTYLRDRLGRTPSV